MRQVYCYVNRKFSLGFKFLFVVITLLFLSKNGKAQLAAWDFTGASSPVTFTATTFNSNLVSTSGANTITRGGGAAASAGGGSFRTTGFQNDGISTSNTDYFQITLGAVSGYTLSLSTIDAIFAGTGSFVTSPGVTSQYAYSLNGTTFTLIGSPVTSTSLTPAQISLSGISALQNVPNGTTIYIRYYASGQTTTGGWGFNSPSSGMNGLAIGGTLTNSKTSNGTGGGDWATGSTWVGGIAPSATDNVIIAVSDVVSTAASITRTGTTTVYGAFQLNGSGYASGTDFTYAGLSSKLIFNSGALYGVGSTPAYWPTANSPHSVTVMSGSGADLQNAAGSRTIAGTLSIAGQFNIGTASALTLSDSLLIKTNGYISGNAPLYSGSSSLLVYDIGAAYGNALEWTGGGSTTPAVGTGVPGNVTIQTTSTNLSIAGSRGVPGNVTISSGAVLTLSGGDLYLGGNLTQNGGSGGLINSGKAVFFVLSNAIQTITATTGPVYFDYFIINKPSGTVQLSGTDVTLNSTTGSVLQIINSGDLDLNGRSINFNNTNGNIQIDGASRSIKNTNATAANFIINGNKAFTTTSAGSVSIGTNIIVQVNNAGINFGNTIATINGTLQLNNGGSVIAFGAPIYGSSSVLNYNSGSVFNRGDEWLNNATVGTKGGPQDITITNSTILNVGGTTGSQVSDVLTAGGKLTVTGGDFYMDYGGQYMTKAVTINGDVNLATGTGLSLSGVSGGDLKVGGNIIFTAPYTFTGNGRAVYFIKNGTQTITSSGQVPNFPYIIFAPVSGSTTVQLAAASSINVTAPLGGNAISFSGASDVFDINGNTLVIGTGGAANSISGSGTFKGSNSSNLSLLGSGSIGTLNFTSGSQNLGILTLNRTAGAVAAALGTDLTVNTQLSFTNGLLNIGSNNLTFASGATATGASLNSFAEADGSGTVRKVFTGNASFTYPVGDNVAPDGAQYSPATLTFSGSTAYSSAYAGVRVTDTKQPNVVAATDYISRYWSISSSGITNPTYSFSGTYTAADIAGTETNSISGQYDGTTWIPGASCGSNTVSLTGLTSLPTQNDCTGGNPLVTPVLVISNTGTPATGTINVSTSNVILSAFNIAPNSLNNFTAVTITATGGGSPATSSDLSNVRIIYDANANGLLDAGEISSNVVGAGMAYAGSMAFTITGQTGFYSSRRYFVVADVSATAVAGHTTTTSIAGTSDVTTSITNKSGTAAGNQQTIAFTSAVSDYFQSNVSSGLWSAAGSWLSSHDGTNFYASTLVPTSAANTINIAANNTITINSTVSLDQTTITGTLVLATGGLLTINNGTGDDITITSGAVFQVTSSTAYSTAITTGASVINVLNGGKITLGDGTTTIGSGYDGLASSANNIWNTNAILEWNNTGTFAASGITYFTNASSSTIPIFRITKMSASTAGGGSNTIVNGILEVNFAVSFSGSGTKTFRDGIRGTNTLTQSSGSGSFNLTGTAPILDGTALQIVLNSPLNLSSSCTVPSGAFVTISGANISNNTSPNILTINGTLDITTIQITNTSATVSVNGTIRTAYTGIGGLIGTNGAIPSGTVNLNTNSTAEYYANGTQYVTNPGSTPAFTYYNITISGTGTKVLSTTSSMAATVGGTVTVNAGAALDVTNTSFGNSSTNLTLVGTGKFLNAGASTKPDMGGTYTLGTGSTIEFDGTAATLLRLVNYYNLYITGTNVTTSTNTAVISMQSGGTFTVAAGGKFKTRSSTGFSGGASTSVGNANNPTISLDPASTIDYSETAAQVITNQVAYGNLEISAASGTKTAPAGTLSILGNLTKSGAALFAHNNGTVSLDGTTATTQSFTAIDSMDVYKLINNNTNGGFTVNGALGVAKLLTLSANSKLIFGTGDIRIRSTSSLTGSIDQVPTTAGISYTGAGRFIIERYISHVRKWQFLSTNATNASAGSQTFQSAFMEGQTPGTGTASGYGMWITGTGAATGFDASSPGATMKIWNGATYTAIGNPTTTAIHTNVDVNSDNAYMTFVRGDRGCTGGNGTMTATVLRLKGSINTGNYPSTPGTLTAFNADKAIGNPYASAVDLSQLFTGNISGTVINIKVWDPLLGGSNNLGGFQYLQGTVAGSVTSFSLLPPGGGSYPAAGTTMNTLESGQAFFLQSSTVDINYRFKETAKALSANQVFFTAGQPQKIFGYLSLHDATGTTVVDGLSVQFDAAYNNAADFSDARKMTNTNENVSVKTNGILLAGELRQPLVPTDTIHINIANLRATDYEWKFDISNLDEPGRVGFLVDQFLGTETQFNLDGTNTYDFSANGAASAAADRFMIVFKPANVVPVHLVAVSAVRQSDKTILVKWNAENEINIGHYEVQRSGDGSIFNIQNSRSAVNNNGGSAQYNFIDQNPLTADNYYRIKAVSNNGQVQYSAIVKVGPMNKDALISIYPNPVKDGVFNVKFENKVAGAYQLQLSDKAGRTIYTQTVNISSGNEVHTININRRMPAGSYDLMIVGPGGERVVEEVVVE